MRGFTLIEMLVIIAIMAVLATAVLLYNRTGERQIVLFKEQAKIVGVISRAKSLSLQTFSQTGVPCAYGVHFDAASGRYSLFKDDADDCRDADYRLTAGSADAVLEEFVLDANLKFKDETDFTDIVFIPPDPKVAITPDRDEATAAIETRDGASFKRIKFNSAGQITVE